MGRIVPTGEKYQPPEARTVFEEVEAVRRKLRYGDKCVVDPTTKWVRYWDGVTFAALIFTAIVTPVEVPTSVSFRPSAL